jgi:hypothetical protein
MQLTKDQKVTNNETREHIEKVRNYIGKVITELVDRSEKHDQSKLVSPEVEIFTEFTPKLSSTTYGSEEYNNYKNQMSVALKHHYANNRHHPEHHKNGIDDMTLIDLIEMLCDWKAASERHNDGNIKKSIDHNASRFGMNSQLTKIFENTAKELF